MSLDSVTPSTKRTGRAPRKETTPMRATIYTYPWDLTDEGIDSALDTIAHTAGLNSVSLAQSYHISTYFLPHNPRRPLYWGEEGALYFQPSATFYDESPIAPLSQQRRRWPRLHAPDRRQNQGARPRPDELAGLQLQPLPAPALSRRGQARSLWTHKLRPAMPNQPLEYETTLARSAAI